MTTIKKIFLWMALLISILFFISSFIKIIIFILYPNSGTIKPGVEFFVIVIFGLIIDNIQKKLNIKKLFKYGK